MLFPRHLPALALLAAAAAAQPASDLLQSAIFAEETSGDLGGAIRIYQQILAAGPSMRLYAPLAQYHLGLCLLHKKDSAGARRAFEALIRDYPDERDLIARARELMPVDGALMPAPWSDPEVAEYRWTIPGVDEGWSITRIGAASKDHDLRIQTAFYGPQQNTAMVDVDRDTMATHAAHYRGPSPQNARTPTSGVYSTPDAAAPFALPKSAGPLFSQAELPSVLRRLPPQPGESRLLLLRAPGAPSVTALRATVEAAERITVPAGSFDCVRIRLSPDNSSRLTPPPFSTMSVDFPMPRDGETYWIARDGARPIVKIAFADMHGELTGLRSGQTQGTSAYRDVAVGYSFTVPPGWVYHARNAVTGDGKSVDLIDPDSLTVVVISGKTVHTAPGDIEAALQSGLESRKADPGRQIHVNGPVRHQAFPLPAGYLSLTRSARNEQNGRVSQTTWMQSTATRVSITFSTDESSLPGILQRLQPLFDSFRMP